MCVIAKYRLLIRTTIQSTGFLRASARDVSATGLRTFRTGESHATDTGAHLLTSGSANADIRKASEAAQSSKKRARTARTTSSFTDHTLMT